MTLRKTEVNIVAVHLMFSQLLLFPPLLQNKIKEIFGLTTMPSLLKETQGITYKSTAMWTKPHYYTYKMAKCSLQ